MASTAKTHLKTLQTAIIAMPGAGLDAKRVRIEDINAAKVLNMVNGSKFAVFLTPLRLPDELLDNDEKRCEIPVMVTAVYKIDPLSDTGQLEQGIDRHEPLNAYLETFQPNKLSGARTFKPAGDTMPLGFDDYDALVGFARQWIITYTRTKGVE